MLSHYVGPPFLLLRDFRAPEILEKKTPFKRSLTRKWAELVLPEFLVPTCHERVVFQCLCNIAIYDTLGGRFTFPHRLPGKINQPRNLLLPQLSSSLHIPTLFYEYLVVKENSI